MCTQNRIILQDVCFHYPQKQTSFELLNINLNISANLFTVISGPNGSGKTTLGKLMVGILKPVHGHVLLLGTKTTNLTLAECGRRVGYLFQNPARQLFTTSVYEELYFSFFWRGIPQAQVQTIIEQQLNQFDLKHLSNRAPHTLSRGEQQRLAIAAIMLHNPKFLILDEPTSSLDALRKQQLGTLLDQLKKQGTGIIIISHDDTFIQAHAEQIIRLSGGRLDVTN